MTNISLQDIDERLQRLEDRFIREFGTRINDHEKRIRANESFRYKVYGWAAAISAVVGLAANYIADMIKK